MAREARVKKRIQVITARARAWAKEIDAGAAFILAGCVATLWWLALSGGVPALASSVGLVTLLVGALAAGHVRKRRPAVSRALGVAIILGSMLAAAPSADAAVPTPAPAPVLVLPYSYISDVGVIHPTLSLYGQVSVVLAVVAVWVFMAWAVWHTIRHLYDRVVDGIAYRVAARVRGDIDRLERALYPSPAEDDELPPEAYAPGEIIEE